MPASMDTITLKKLKLLEAVSRLGSFTLAAREVHLSQPAVSVQLKALEEAAGLELIEKSNRRLQLTGAGQVVLQAAHDITGRLDQMKADIEGLKGDVVGPLNIAVVSSAKYFLPHFLGQFVRKYPDVKPRLTVTNRASLLEAVADNRHDLYVMGQMPDDLDVVAHTFLDNILEVIAPPQHALVSHKNISLERIVKERFLVREPGSGTRKAIDRVFAGHKLAISPYMELGSSGAIKNGVMAGLGIAVLSRHSLQLELDAKRVSILDVEGFPLRRRWYAVHPRHKRLSFTAKTFLEHLQHGYRNLPGP